MVDKVAPVLDPLLDLIFDLIEYGIHAVPDILEDILLGDAECRLRIVLWDRKRCRYEDEEGQERDSHRCWLW